MRYIKNFESVNETIKPVIGDYVLCYEDVDDMTTMKYKNLAKFLSENIGQINYYPKDMYDYVVKYNNVPDEISDYFAYDVTDNNSPHDKRAMRKNEILYWSKDIDDIKMHIESNKYNL